jgi:hypothetical protein
MQSVHSAQIHSASLSSVLHHPRVWQASQSPTSKVAGISTGFVALNRELPEAGWSCGALVEIHHAADGIGELSLLLPALATITQQRRSIAWILHGQQACIPNAQALLQAQVELSKLVVVRAPQLADYYWACEQAMRSGAFSAVVCALDMQMDYAQLRRLQLACVHGGTVGFALRPAVLSQHSQDESALQQTMLQYQPNPSPSPLRLLLAPVANDQFPQLAVHVFKRRGFAMNAPLLLRTGVQRLTTVLRMPQRSSLPRQIARPAYAQQVKTVNVRSDSRLLPHY